MSKIAGRNRKTVAERPLPDLEFRHDGDKVIETVSTLPAYTTGNHFVMIDPLPTPDDRLRTALYFNQDGSPADEITKYWLLRDAADFLTVWYGHVYREPSPPGNEGINFADDPIAAMEQFNRVHPVDAGSGSEDFVSAEILEQIRDRRPLPDVPSDPDDDSPTERWDEWLASKANAGSRSTRRRLLQLPPSAWRILVVRRLALFFGRSVRDTLLRELAEYFCRDDNWTAWLEEPRFAVLTQRVATEARIGRLLNVLHEYTVLRSGRHENERVFGRRREVTLSSRRGKYVFDFPPGDRKGRRAAAATQILLLVSSVRDHQKAFKAPSPRLCAAAVYEAREFLIAPKSLRDREITQARVARHFRISRRQLQGGLTEIREPGYTDRVFRLVPFGKLIRP